MAVNSLCLRSWQCHLPKQGERPEDCEDACAADPEGGRFAVADGAAGSSCSALWARLLVEGFVKSPQPTAWADWLPSARQRWLYAVESRAASQATPWYVEERLQQGAFAAFLGLVVDEVMTWHGGRRKRWHALAMGDCCLFQVRAGQLLHALPLSRAQDFDNTPWLVGARTANDQTLLARTVQRKGDWQPGDRFWLMTDALALWFVQQAERGRKPWRELERLSFADEPVAPFAEWIDDLRTSQVLRNDDVTLLAVCS